MFAENENQESNMEDLMAVIQTPGYAMNSGAVAPRRPEAMNFLPFVQYPIDDELPVEAWVFELPVRPAVQDPFKPLRPEVERAAIEAINRHLPPSERIETTQPSHTGTELVVHSRPRRQHRTFLPPAPRSWHGLNRPEAAKAPVSPEPAKPARAKRTGRKRARRGKSKNKNETEDKNREEE